MVAVHADNIIPLLRAKWQQDALKNAQGKILPNLANAMLALRGDPDVRDVFAYDDMSCAAVMTHEIARIDTINRFMRDSDIVDVLEWMQHHGIPGLKLEVMRTAVNQRAHESRFHPVVDYLASLQHDGVPRLRTWLTSFLGAELSPYNENIGRMFLLSMVARVLRPGCQADHMMVLEGPQGILKSSAARVLGGEWFSDNLPEISGGDNRAASQHLRGKWLIEVAEMHAFSKAEATKLKSFISRREEIYLPRYAHTEVHEARQCVFIGTTNEDGYLRDPTGGRRFWPVKTGVSGRIELDLLAQARDQLFAEALDAYNEGGNWWPDRALEEELIKPQQAERYAGDIWEAKITDYLAQRIRDAAEYHHDLRVTIPQVAFECLTIPYSQQTRVHEARIAGVMRERGWVPKRTKTERFWVYGYPV